MWALARSIISVRYDDPLVAALWLCQYAARVRVLPRRCGFDIAEEIALTSRQAIELGSCF
jgi:hypothetical protein